MGACMNTSESFSPKITTKLEIHFKHYIKIVRFIKSEKLFSERTDRLDQTVAAYLQHPMEFDKQNMELCAVDSVYKLHPHDYAMQTATHEWLISACLRHSKFIEQLDIKRLNFQFCYYEYIEFIQMHKRCPNQIFLPSLKGNFMWHSHMQNPQKYKANMETILGKFLNHQDDFTLEELKKHKKRTDRLRTARDISIEEASIDNVF